MSYCFILCIYIFYLLTTYFIILHVVRFAVFYLLYFIFIC